MATPHVSGVIALILSQNPNLSPDQIKETLKNTALDLKEDKNSQGTGRIQAYEAFIEATNLETSNPDDESNPEDEKKEQAKKKAREEENLEKIDKVRDKEEDGEEYFVVDGTRPDYNGEDERVWVYVNKDSGIIEKVKIIGFLKGLIINILDFFKSLFT
jgi:hypothetical protein